MKYLTLRHVGAVRPAAVCAGAFVCLLSVALGAGQPAASVPALVPSGVTAEVKTASVAPTLELPGEVRSTRMTDVISHYGYWVTIVWLAPEGSYIAKGETAARVTSENLSDRAAATGYWLEETEADACAKQAAIGLAEAERRLTLQRAQWDMEEAKLELALLEAGPRVQELQSAELAVKRAGLELAAADASVARLGRLTAGIAISQEKIAEAAHGRDLARIRLSEAENDLALLMRGADQAALLAAQAKAHQAEGGLQAAKESAEADRSKDAADLAAARARVESVSATYAELEGSNEAMIRPATASGIVVWPSIYTGGEVRPGGPSLWATPILDIVDPRQVIFVARATEEQVSQLQVGMEAQVRVGGLPGGLLTGKVTVVAPTSEDLAASYKYAQQEQYPETGVQMYKVTIQLDGRPAGLDLYQGMAGRAEVRVGKPVARTVVPRACVETADGRDWVSVRSGGKWVTRPVVLAGGDAEYAAVEQGLKPGESVAVLAK